MFVFMEKQYTKNFALFFLSLSSYLPMEFVNFLKSRLIFNFLLYLNVFKQTFRIPPVRIFQKVKGVLM